MYQGEMQSTRVLDLTLRPEAKEIELQISLQVLDLGTLFATSLTCTTYKLDRFWLEWLLWKIPEEREKYETKENTLDDESMLSLSSQPETMWQTKESSRQNCGRWDKTVDC